MFSAHVLAPSQPDSRVSGLARKTQWVIEEERPSAPKRPLLSASLRHEFRKRDLRSVWGIMIVAYDGNKARKARSIWLEIDVMSVANTIRFLKKCWCHAAKIWWPSSQAALVLSSFSIDALPKYVKDLLWIKLRLFQPRTCRKTGPEKFHWMPVSNLITGFVIFMWFGLLRSHKIPAQFHHKKNIK